MERAIHRGTINPTRDGEFAYRLAESHRTILEFYIISAAIDEVPGVDERRLNLALSGRELPEEDVRTTGARDAQFELLVTALVHHAGIHDVVVGEPDIRIKAGDRWLGIAAKRISSRTQLEKRLRSAAKQIRRQDDYGVIALNLDPVITAVHHLHGSDRARDAFRSIIPESTAFVHSLDYGTHVAGVQGFATLLGWEPTVEGAVMSVDVLSHIHLVSPELDHDRMEHFVRGRGIHLEERLAKLLSLVA